MSENSTEILPFLVLNSIIDDDYRKIVVRHTLGSRSEASGPARRRLASVMRKDVQVKGYRDPSRVRLSVALGPVVEASYQSNELMGAILEVWVESHADLQQLVDSFLSTRETPTVDLSALTGGFPGRWTATEMIETAEAFQAEHLGCDLDDVALMLCCITGQAPIPDDITDATGIPVSEETSTEKDEQEEDELPEESEVSRWQGWLGELSELPADSREWEGVPEFVESLQALATAKLQEREASRFRAMLQVALKNLIEEAADELAYFEFEDVALWSPRPCTHSEAEIWLEHVERFRTDLEQHRDMLRRPAGTRAEAKERRRLIEELEEQVVQEHDELASLFETSPPPQEPEPTGPPEQPEPEAELSEEPAAAEAPAAEDLPPEEEWVAEIEPIEKEELPAEEERVAEIEPIEEEEPPSKEEQVAEAEPAEEEELQVQQIAPTSEEAPAEEESETMEDGVRAALEEAVDERVPPEPSEPDEPVEAEEPETPRADREAEASPVLKPSPQLRSSKEIALALETDDNDDNWIAFLWALIAEDDLPGAYWLAKSLTASGRVTPLLDGLLAAAQGARWLSPDSDMYVHDLLNLVQEHRVAPDPAQEMIGLAASLRPALVSPHSGLGAWLKVTTCSPAFHDLASAVMEFTSAGVPLRPEDLLGIAGAQQRQATLTEAAEAAQRWLDEAPQRRTKLKRASDVWRYLATRDLQEMLLPVSENRQSELEKVRFHLRQWQQQGFVSDRIDQVDDELAVTKAQPIFGSPRQQIIRNVEEACDIARHWCSLVRHEREVQTRGKWLFDQITTLRADIEEIMPRAEKALVELEDSSQPAPIAAAAYCLRRALNQLQETLALQLQIRDAESLATNSWALLQFDVENLPVALSRRLLWLPEISLAEDGQPDQRNLLMVPKALRDACVEGRSLQDAFEGWLQKQDYRFCEWLLAVLHDEADTVRLSARLHEARAGSQAALSSSKERTINEVEQAVVDGIIYDEQRSEYSAEIEAVDPIGTLDFDSKYEALRRVQEGLSSAYEKRLADLEEYWQALQERLEQSPIGRDKKQQVYQFIETALKHGNTRVAEEGFARLAEALDVGRALDENLFARPDSRDLLSEFKEAESAIWAWLEAQTLQQVAASIKRGQSHAGIMFGELPAKRRDEASQALHAWRRLKQQTSEANSIPQYVSILLRYLGFSLEPDAETPVEVRTSGPDWEHLRVSMSASDLAKPIPQFGSQAHGCYDVVCLWDRPGAATIAARLLDLQLSVQNVLVVFLGRLTMRQRADLTRVSREKELALAVLDETLLVFLAQERDVRLPAFLRCALPFAALNPYTPFQAGDVPPEMFYGREDMARELQRPAGSCLVYGGRQLGKSALLRHVARQFHYPSREQYGWVQNLKLIYLPEAGKETDNIWRALREGFKEYSLLSKRVRTDRPEEISRYIREVMNEVPDRRVLVMFDEADEFLDADSADGFRQVIGLRELMLGTERRFKVIFAGLHSVQRFQGIPNQPLAHFGAPLCVGPLEPDAAQQLVREPLEALGYRFTDNATVLRVLSYTNYHPGLIQLFCQELLNELYNEGGDSLPPHSLEQRIVEAVYRRPQLRERIRERFDWTLALDMRYQAIAWTLIEDQMRTPDSYSRPYPSGDILRRVRGLWPQGFRGIDSYQLRGLLDEMRGLGVLVRNGDGYYRLRSPNLVRLMGAVTDVEDRLLELMEKQPPQPPDADNHHAPLDDAARHYSPLTYSQERALNPPGFGVGLVFASKAGGASSLEHAFERFVPPDLPEDSGVIKEIPRSIMDGNDLRDWLATHMQTYAKHDRQVLYHRPGIGSPEDLASLVQEALAFCQRYQSRSRWMRLLFVFEPRATWKWLALPQHFRERLENQVDAVALSRPWNLVGLRQRLAQHDKLHSDAICSQILKATGGWHSLIEEIFERASSQDDPRPFALEIEAEIRDPKSRLRQDLSRSLGLEVNHAIDRVIRFIAGQAQDGITTEYITPDFVGGQPTLTPEECLLATEFLQRMACIDVQGQRLTISSPVGALLSET